MRVESANIHAWEGRLVAFHTLHIIESNTSIENRRNALALILIYVSFSGTLMKFAFRWKWLEDNQETTKGRQTREASGLAMDLCGIALPKTTNMKARSD